MCVAMCSGQAIFLVDEEYEVGYSAITLPYEFLPLPEVGEIGVALSRSGAPICKAEIVKMRTTKTFDKTNLLTMKVPTEFIKQARFYRGEVSDHG